ncbi:neuronal acetylcholine receptor subunit alpha-9-like [Lineus longissimus]|uniref:neuronal acetylcholine receptor subunit alpha-9-like n=1 Tax=Lineus longissimus TaxID=88925 RepID=UPI002B4FAD98
MECRINCLLLSAFFLWMAAVAAQEKPMETKLFNHLMKIKGYEKNVRPVQNSSEVTKVTFSVSLVKLADLNEKDQILTTNVWIRHAWHDYQLKWQPSKWGDVKSLRIPISMLWTPDLVLFNGDSKRAFEPLAVVSSDGKVLWIPYATLNSFCALNMESFPFDEQICTLKFGSWAYDGLQVDMVLNEGFPAVDTRYFMEHYGWDITSSKVNKSNIYYACCPEPYPEVKITLTMKRTGRFYSYFYVAPAVLLCFLIPLIFWLPVGCQEKTTIGIGILIGMSVLIMMLGDLLPSDTESMPLLGQYYIAVFVLTVLALILVTFTINLGNAENKDSRVPDWLRKTCLVCVGRIFCVIEGHKHPGASEATSPDGGESVGLSEKGTTEPGRMECCLFTAEWRRVAQVFDRLFLVVFLVFCIILTVALLCG